MKSIIILDDDQRRVDKFCQRLCRTDVTVVWARSAPGMIDYLNRYHWDHIFLDHDLGLTGPDAGNGTQVVQHILLLHSMGRFHNTKFWIHSANDERAGWMYRALKSAGMTVRDAPEAWEKVMLERKAG